MPSSHLILCRPLLLLPPTSPSIRVFSNESTLHMRWPKYWSFSFSIIPSKEIPGLIFRMDWLDLLAVQGTLKSLLQHHSSEASILQQSAFFIVQLKILQVRLQQHVNRELPDVQADFRKVRGTRNQIAIPKYSLKGFMMKVKLQYLDHLIQRTDSFEKTLML